ncbi:ATP phosphoribosyltransferase regulatory subunit [Candidatus Pacearchaeota archaeon]|nr:ATP phosphoribosyltransferase regulatory subunit [Candidatus Pacearchaeota archaeon]
MNTQTVKGFQDFIGKEAQKRVKIKQIIQEQFELYGFEPAETPVMEFKEFVQSGNSNDEAVRDVFKLEDRGKRKLALRYEFTFQLKRIAKNQKLPYKRYQVGYNFRDEPIKKGRTRQFIQCDADIVGSSVKDEAECLKLGKNIFEKLDMPVKIYVNNRRLINEILVSEKVEEKNRDQVIRELDKLDKLSKKEVADNLKKLGAEKLLKIFGQSEKEFEKYNFYKEIKELKKICKTYGFKVEFKPFLARGLSYYNSTIFEIWSKELDVSLCGGGSYLIGDTQSTGITFGLEPIYLLSKIEGDRIKVQIISIGQDDESIQLAEKLRNKGISVNLLLDKSIGKAMDYANSKGIEKVIFIGKEEIAKKKFRVKDMKTGKEEFLSESNVLKV